MHGASNKLMNPCLDHGVMASFDAPMMIWVALGSSFLVLIFPKECTLNGHDEDMSNMFS
jgi:hypothetical protein